MPELAAPLQSAAPAPAAQGAKTAAAAGATPPTGKMGFLDQLGQSISVLNGAPAAAIPTPATPSAQTTTADQTAKATIAEAAPSAAAALLLGAQPAAANPLAAQPSPAAGDDLTAATKGSPSRPPHPRNDTGLVATQTLPSPTLPSPAAAGAPTPSPATATTDAASTGTASTDAASTGTDGTPDPQPALTNAIRVILAAQTAPAPSGGAVPASSTSPAPAKSATAAPAEGRRPKRTSDAATDPATNQANAIAGINLSALPLLPANAAPAQLPSQPAPLPPQPPGLLAAARASETAAKAKPLAAAPTQDLADAPPHKFEVAAAAAPGAPTPADAATLAATQAGPTAQSALQGAAPLLAQAAAAASSQATHTATNSPSPPAVQVAQAIADPVRVVLAAPAQHTAGPHVTTIQLDPADLGRVEIRIERSADGPAKIDLAVERPETLLRLVHDQPQLQQTLDQAGIPQQGRTINFSLAPNSGAGDASSFTSFAGGGPAGGNGQRYPQGSGNSRAPAADIDEISILKPTWNRLGLNITA